MAITATCSACGRSVSAPDAAAGRKARCPHCGGVVDIPAASPAAALNRGAERRAGEPVATAVATPTPAAAAVTPRERSSVIRNGSGSSTRASTAIERIAARTSPYGPLRLLATVLYGMGIALALAVIVGGLAALVIVSISGYPAIGVGVFAGGLVVGLVIFLGAKTLNELLRLWADVGDRMRQMVQMLDDSLARSRGDVL